MITQIIINKRGHRGEHHQAEAKADQVKFSHKVFSYFFALGSSSPKPPPLPTSHHYSLLSTDISLAYLIIEHLQ